MKQYIWLHQRCRGCEYYKAVTMDGGLFMGCFYEKECTPVINVTDCPHTITADELRGLMKEAKDEYPLTIWFKGKLPTVSQYVETYYSVMRDERYKDGSGLYSITYKGEH